MTWLSAGLAALAVWLWVQPSRVPGAGGEDRGRQARRLWPGWLLAPLAGLAVLPLAGWGVTASLVLAIATASRVVRSQRMRTLSVRARGEIARSCQGLAALLRLGMVPSVALAEAARDGAVFADADAARRVGAEVPAAPAGSARRPGWESLAEVAAAWEVAEASGASLTAALDAVAERLAAAQEQRRLVEAELAAPRATGRTLAVLPLTGVLLGLGLGGDPVGFLTRTLPGQVCLVTGVGLACLGLLWTEWLAARNGG